MKSEYRKQKEKERLFTIYVVLAILVFSLFLFAGRVQQACIAANNVTMCD